MGYIADEFERNDKTVFEAVRTNFLVGQLHVMPSSLYVACLQGIMGVVSKMTWIWLISSCFWETPPTPPQSQHFFTYYQVEQNVGLREG